MEIPIAPGLGLYLDEVYFDNYNTNQAKLAVLHDEKIASNTVTKNAVALHGDVIPSTDGPVAVTEVGAAVIAAVTADAVASDAVAADAGTEVGAAVTAVVTEIVTADAVTAAAAVTAGADADAENGTEPVCYASE